MAALDRARLSAVSDARALLVRRVDLGPQVRLDRTEAGEVHVEVVRALAQLAREIAQLLGQPGSRIVRVLALCPELVGNPIELLGLPVGGFADLCTAGR